MSAVTSPTSPAGMRFGVLRAGLSLAAILALFDIVFAIMNLVSSDAFGLTVSIGMVALGLVTLLLVPLAWRRRRGAAIGAAVVRVIASLAALPAFFVPGVPAPFVLLAAIGIVLAVAAAVLILAGLGRRS